MLVKIRPGASVQISNREHRQLVLPHEDKWIECGPPFTLGTVTLSINGVYIGVPNSCIKSIIGDKRELYYLCKSCGKVFEGSTKKCPGCSSKFMRRLFNNYSTRDIREHASVIIGNTFGV